MLKRLVLPVVLGVMLLAGGDAFAGPRDYYPYGGNPYYGNAYYTNARYNAPWTGGRACGNVAPPVRAGYGVPRGLTPKEVARLRSNQRQIRQMERAFHSDGYLSPGERARLNIAYEKQQRRIHRELNDRDVRW